MLPPIPRRDRWIRSLLGRPIPPVSLDLSDDGLPQVRDGSAPTTENFEASSGVHLRCGLLARGTAVRSFASKASTVSLPPPPLRLLPAGATQLPGGNRTR